MAGAQSLNGEAADPRIEQDCIRGLFAQGRQASFIGLVIGAMIVAALWDSVPRATLLGWYALVVLNQGIRVLMVGAFFAASPAGEEASRAGTWARRYADTMFTGGLLYGVTPLLLWPQAEASQIFVLMMVVGLAAGSIAANAFHLPTMYAYLTPLILPSILRLAYSGRFEYTLIAVTNAFYYLMLIGFGRRQSVLLRNSFALAYRNEDLAQALQKKSQAAEQAQHAAEQASLAKSKLFAAASHDLRDARRRAGRPDPLQRRRAGVPLRRIARHLQARRRLRDARAGALRRRPRVRAHRRRLRTNCGAVRPAAALHAHPGRAPQRRLADRAGARQPGFERNPLHPGRRRAGRMPQARCGLLPRSVGYRHRHRRAGPRAHLRGIHPAGKSGARPQQGPRARPRHGAPHRRRARHTGRSALAGRPGQRIPPAGAGRRPGAGD